MKNRAKGSYFVKWLKEYIAKEFTDTDASLVMKMESNTPFKEVGLDSLDILELGYQLEEVLDVSLPDPELRLLGNIGATEAYLNRQLAEKGKTSSIAKCALALEITKAFDDSFGDFSLTSAFNDFSDDYWESMHLAIMNIETKFGLSKFHEPKLPESIYPAAPKRFQLCGAYTMGGLVNRVARRIEYET